MRKIIIGLLVVLTAWFGGFAIADKLSNNSTTAVATGDYVEVYLSGTSTKNNVTFGSLAQNLATTGLLNVANGTIYLGSIVDTAIYSKTPTVSTARNLCISVDGTIYGTIAPTCL